MPRTQPAARHGPSPPPASIQHPRLVHPRAPHGCLDREGPNEDASEHLVQVPRAEACVCLRPGQRGGETLREEINKMI